MLVKKPPIAFLVRVADIAPRNVAANAEMIEFRFMRAQTNFDVAQALAERQLRESHAEILIEMREGFGRIVRRIPRDTTAKCVQRKKIHKLRENQFADEH